jgi:hypothetical protein
MIDVHVALDDALGRLHSLLAPDDVLAVFSTKGMEASRGECISMMLLPELLHRRYFGTHQLPSRSLATWRMRGCPPVIPHVGLFHSQYMQHRFGLHGPELWRAENRDRWLRVRRRIAERLAPASVERRTRPIKPLDVAPIIDADRDTLEPETGTLDSWLVASWYRSWWAKSPAFVLPSFSDTHIRLNVAGRERDGMIDSDDYARACDDVENFVRECTSGRTGNEVVADVSRLRQSDPLDPDAPYADLVISFAEEADALEHPVLGAVGPVPLARVATHTNRGYALFTGAGIPPAVGEPRPEVDLPATLCALVGANSASPLDGMPIPLFDESLARA